MKTIFMNSRMFVNTKAIMIYNEEGAEIMAVRNEGNTREQNAHVFWMAMTFGALLIILILWMIWMWLK